MTEQPQQQELKLDDAVDTHKTLLSPEPRKAKLPPLTIVPPIRKIALTALSTTCETSILAIPTEIYEINSHIHSIVPRNTTSVSCYICAVVETQAIPFVHPFGKSALPIVVKQDLLDAKIPAVFEAEQFEDLSVRTSYLAALESANVDNHDMSKSSPVTEPCETPTLATKSPADSEWRSLHRDTPDPDVEDIVLLESQELDSLDSLPLIPMLNCHGIHMDKKDLISPSLRLIS